MQVTPEYLAALRQGLEEQRLRGLGLVNQALGAMAIIDQLAKHLGTPEPEALSEEDLKRALGADEVKVVPIKQQADG